MLKGGLSAPEQCFGYNGSIEDPIDFEPLDGLGDREVLRLPGPDGRAYCFRKITLVKYFNALYQHVSDVKSWKNPANNQVFTAEQLRYLIDEKALLLQNQYSFQVRFKYTSLGGLGVSDYALQKVFVKTTTDAARKVFKTRGKSSRVFNVSVEVGDHDFDPFDFAPLSNDETEFVVHLEIKVYQNYVEEFQKLQQWSIQFVTDTIRSKLEEEGIRDVVVQSVTSSIDVKSMIVPVKLNNPGKQYKYFWELDEEEEEEY